MTKSFNTAVLDVIKEFTDKQEQFSAYDVTKRLRELVNTGAVELDQRQFEDVDGQTTFRIDHGEVRDAVRAAYVSGAMGDYKRQRVGAYFLYVPEVIGGDNQDNDKDDNQPIKLPCPGDDAIYLTIKGYIEAKKAKKEPVTLHLIQKRLKRVCKMTCKDIAELIANKGNWEFSTSTLTPLHKMKVNIKTN